MRISHEHRFVFFASPKTGSRSVRRLLDAYFKLVMVRNPWSRLVSPYEMFAFREGRLVSRLRRRTTRHQGFRAWLRTLDPEGGGGAAPGLEKSVIRVGAYSYIGFTGDEGGRPLVDEVIKLEEIESGFGLCSNGWASRCRVGCHGSAEAGIEVTIGTSTTTKPVNSSGHFMRQTSSDSAIPFETRPV